MVQRIAGQVRNELNVKTNFTDEKESPPASKL